MLHYFTVNTSVETICFLIAVFCLLKDANLIWRSMVLFLFITCLAEMLGIYIKRLNLTDLTHIHPNGWVYNILLIFQAGFFSMMFQYLIGKYVNSKLFILSGFVLLIVIHCYRMAVNTFSVYDQLTNTVMSVMLVLYSLYFYYCLIKDDGYINLKRSPAFWWVAGILFFYFGTTASNLFYDKLSVLTVGPQSLKYLKYIYYLFNIILYSCWSYSFICRQWQTMTSRG